MGVDSRGVESGKYTKCDCEEYKAKDGQNECGYCGCFPAQLERLRSESSECQEVAEEEVPKTEGTPKWMNTSLGWLPYAKTKDAIFLNELLPQFHESAWQFWPNGVSFRQAFVET